MAGIPIRVIVGILLVVTLGYSPALAQPAPPSDAETPALAATKNQTPPAASSLTAPAAESPAAPTPGPAGETPAAPTPAPAAGTAAAPGQAPATETATAPIPVPPAVSQTRPIFRAEQLNQLVAPIAPYPDALLAQILMAATYPLEIVKADRWVHDSRHAALRGDLLARALEAEAWDPSVKALVTFPSILRMMDINLDWTEQLGDAFLAQQGDVMDAIQRLRHEAAAAGSLRSNAQQRVVIEGQGIVIESANPALIYPPVYAPAVYGPWPYPDYPPLNILPSDYGLGFAVPFGIGFGAGFVVVRSVVRRCAFDWGGHRILLGVDPPAHASPGIEPTAWQHDPTHRRGVLYLDPGSRQRFGERGDHPVSLAARIDIPSTRPGAAEPTGLSNPGLRAFAPAARGPAARGWIASGAARRPMVPGQLAPQIISRRSPIYAMPQAFTSSRAAGGGLGFGGLSHR
jgi:Protein of unknown function (DUF3300)